MLLRSAVWREGGVAPPLRLPETSSAAGGGAVVGRDIVPSEADDAKMERSGQESHPQYSQDAPSQPDLEEAHPVTQKRTTWSADVA